jgi:hypothetical protein
VGGTPIRASSPTPACRQAGTIDDLQVKLAFSENRFKDASLAIVPFFVAGLVVISGPVYAYFRRRKGRHAFTKKQ